MKRVSILFSLLLLSGYTLMGQKPAYSVKVKMQPLAEDKYVYLAHYFGNSQYIKVDSAKIDKGTITFEGSEPLKGGLYLLVLSPSKFYDIAIDGKEQFMEIEADTADFVKTVQFTNSTENEVLFKYRKYLAAKNSEAELIQAEAKLKGDPVAQEMAQVKIKTLQNEVSAFIKEFSEKNKETFAAKIINANKEPELPTELPKKANGRPDSTYLFNYYKGHYFDYIDFADERMVRTPFLQNRVDRYFKDLVYPMKDSVIADCDKVLTLSKQNREVYRFVLWYLTNKYETTDIVGLDGVFIHLAENYYLKDADWLDSTQRAKFQERVNVLKPLQTGKPFPELIITDFNGVEKRVSNNTANYTVVVFYSPDCGHCKDAAPGLVKFYDEYKNKNVKVYSISTDYEVDKIKEFIEKYKTNELENGWDGKGRYYFRNNFDVYSTPTTYILDKDKKIIAKRIPVEELGRFIDFHERQKQLKETSGTK